jgi:hypothetical protein
MPGRGSPRAMLHSSSTAKERLMASRRAAKEALSVSSASSHSRPTGRPSSSASLASMSASTAECVHTHR